jgi:ATP-dependent Clp protease protease subunit
LHLNTTGGNVATGIQIINAIRESAATVTTVLDGEAYSMGAILFLSGDQQAVGDDGQLMFHDYSSGLMGKGNEQRAAVLSAAKWFGKLMVNICSPFLSDVEIEDVLNGRDLWMDSDEVIERLTAIQKKRAEDEKAAAKAAREEAKKKATASRKPATRKAASAPARKKAPAKKAAARRTKRAAPPEQTEDTVQAE